MSVRVKTWAVAGMTLTAALLPGQVHAHGGEDHGEAPPSIEKTVALGASLAVTKETQFLVGIQTALAQQRVMTAKVKATGRFVPRAGGQAEVAPVAVGRVVVDPHHPIARVGDRVVSGDILGVLEQLPADQFALEAAYNAAKSGWEQARQEYARHQELRQVTSVKELQQAEVRLQVAQAEFTRLEEEMQLYEIVHQGGRTVHRLYVRAPIAGTVTEVSLVVGERVDTDRWLFRIVDLDTLWVEAAIYETDLPKIEKAQQAKVMSKAYPGEEFDGRLVGLSGAVDAVSRSAQVFFAVANPGGRLRAGLFAEVAIDTGEPVEGTAVPLAAVLEANGKNLVYLHTQPEEFVGREVELGQRDGDWVEVKTGVSPGERVVIAGAHQLWSQGLR